MHGQGFVGRLSGSTVETISMWMGMFLGKGGFKLLDGQVRLHLSPLLASHMFDENGDAAFMLCGKCPVTYHNPQKKNTFGTAGVRITRIRVVMNETETVFDGDTISEELSLAIRSGAAASIEAWLS